MKKSCLKCRELRKRIKALTGAMKELIQISERWYLSPPDECIRAQKVLKK